MVKLIRVTYLETGAIQVSAAEPPPKLAALVNAGMLFVQNSMKCASFCERLISDEKFTMQIFVRQAHFLTNF